MAANTKIVKTPKELAHVTADDDVVLTGTWERVRFYCEARSIRCEKLSVSSGYVDLARATIGGYVDLVDAKIGGCVNLVRAKIGGYLKLTGYTLPSDWLPAFAEGPMRDLFAACPGGLAAARSAWGKTTWDDCPLHAALRAGSFADCDRLLPTDSLRQVARIFVPLHDAGLLQAPEV